MLITILLEAFELGLIYSVLALGVFLSFRTLNTPDLTVDGSIVTGAAISAVVCTAAAQMPPSAQVLMSVLGLILAFVFGMGAGHNCPFKYKAENTASSVGHSGNAGNIFHKSENTG